jgi:nitroreductase
MTISKQDILDAYQFRHACKEFDVERKIADADFDFILEVARLSPSSFGLEPWQFLVVQNPDLREKLRSVTWGGQKQLPTASHVILTLVRKSHFMRHDSAYLQHIMRDVQQFPEDIIQLRSGLIEKFQRSDFDLLGSERTLTDWATRQTYLPLGNMMTAAAMIGIDSCPIEGFERTEIERILAEDADVNLDHWSAAYMVAFGYRKNPPARPKTRQERDAVVRWLD